MLDIAQEMRSKGYAVIETHPDKKIMDVADEIGILYSPRNMPIVQTLKPRSKKEGNNTYSGNYGFDEFPFHTDMAHWVMPPRFFLLRCKSPSDVVTNIIHGENLLKDIDIDVLSRALFRPRRKVDDKMPLLRFFYNGLMRWDSLFIVPANKEGEKVKAELEAQVTTMKPESVFLDQSGKSVLIDNWKVLHGRGPVTKKSDSLRVVERVYFEGLVYDY